MVNDIYIIIIEKICARVRLLLSRKNSYGQNMFLTCTYSTTYDFVTTVVATLQNRFWIILFCFSANTEK